MAVLESDLRALSAEARRRYPTVKDGAEKAILKVCIQIEHIHLYHQSHYRIHLREFFFLSLFSSSFVPYQVPVKLPKTRTFYGYF